MIIIQTKKQTKENLFTLELSSYQIMDILNEREEIQVAEVQDSILMSGSEGYFGHVPRCQ